jgi:hypothetical protein
MTAVFSMAASMQRLAYLSLGHVGSRSRSIGTVFKQYLHIVLDPVLIIETVPNLMMLDKSSWTIERVFRTSVKGVGFEESGGQRPSPASEMCQ